MYLLGIGNVLGVWEVVILRVEWLGGMGWDGMGWSPNLHDSHSGLHVETKLRVSHQGNLRRI